MIDLDIPLTLKYLKNDSGIKSNILIPIIIAIENARQNAINLLYCLLSILKKIVVAPIRVESPAIVEIKRGINVATCLTYSNILKKRSIYV